VIYGVPAFACCFAQREGKLLLLGEDQLQVSQHGVQKRPSLNGRGQAIEVIPALPPAGKELGACHGSVSSYVA
jgi:hypothetical protein